MFSAGNRESQENELGIAHIHFSLQTTPNQHFASDTIELSRMVMVAYLVLVRFSFV